MEMSKNWEDYTPEDNEALYTEDFDLMKELGLKPAEEEQTSAGFVTVEQGLKPAEEEQTSAGFVSVEQGLKPAEEEQTSAGFVTVEQLERQQLLQLGFSTNLLEKPNTRTSEEEVVWLKQQLLREQQLRQKQRMKSA
ncbi:hypothetical protein WMY93_001189 [Mugilogobius chulae]|uniref:Uncharacterized protein n=1 Tax=Mugilogobius chulae TaxID=88201 RepID=A0AAW0Q2Z1_9GOBI